jgi:hypothetical protein
VQITEIKTLKWNPMTYALQKQNIPLLKYLTKHTSCPLKKLFKIPNLAASNYINKLYPFQPQSYKLLWDDCQADLVSEEKFEFLLKHAILHSYDLKSLLSSRSTVQLFHSMSWKYQKTFLENIIKLKHELTEEVDVFFKNNQLPFD